MWESGRDFQGVWEGWKAGFLAFHAFHTLSFPWPALERVSQSHYSSRRPVLGTGTTCPKCRLSGHVNRISLSVSELVTSRFSKAREEITQSRTT
jgi:hypothetical protein